MAERTGFEALIERIMLGSRWLLAPFCLGLVVSLVLLMVKFTLSAIFLITHALSGGNEQMIIGVLGLVDICLIANLVLMVMFAGYDNFISRLDLNDHPDRPMGRIGFGALKLKLMGNIVAITAIYVLEDFMNASNLADRALAWRSGLLLLFVVTGVSLAWMDRISRDTTGEH